VAGYVNVASTEDLTDEFNVDEAIGDDLPPSWNIAPTDPVRIIVKRRSHGSDDPAADPIVQLRTAKWGLIPSWTRPPASSEKGLVPSWAKDPSIGNRFLCTSQPA
jgi:putative SOS response-associated peptidase YedK